MIEGKFGIKATVICDSISTAGIRLITLEIEYPRLILSELNTHRMLSKNSASSRAIPFAKMQQQLIARPVRFGQANPGMQDKGEDFGALIDGKYSPEVWWNIAKESAIFYAEAFYKEGYHKQVYNRLLEPFQMMKTVISGTELDNFFWLRDDDAADPTIAELARCMRLARDASTPMQLSEDEWHLPYVHRWRDEDGILKYGIFEEGEHEADQGYTILTPSEAVRVSAARCAAVSFRNVDYGVEKCYQVHERLVGDERKHASALEHQAFVMRGYDPSWGQNVASDVETWQNGVSHADREGNLWSGNFRGWIQYRKLIPGENKTSA